MLVGVVLACSLVFYAMIWVNVKGYENEVIMLSESLERGSELDNLYAQSLKVRLENESISFEEYQTKMTELFKSQSDMHLVVSESMKVDFWQNALAGIGLYK